MARLVVVLLMLQTMISCLIVVRLNRLTAGLVLPSSSASLASADVVDIELGDSPVKGASRPAVTIVEFSDFTCGACRKIQPALGEFLARHRDEVRLVFKHFPLRSEGPSMELAVAAECARQQGAFWPMHDSIFSADGQRSPVANLAQLADEIGLEPSELERCMASDASRAAVVEDLEVARSLDLPGTPTLFINGRKVLGIPTLDDLVEIVAAVQRDAAT